MEEIESWYLIVRRDKARPDFFHPSFSIVIPIPANIVLELISLAKRQVSSANFIVIVPPSTVHPRSFQEAKILSPP